jgi:hypothetical protein
MCGGTQTRTCTNPAPNSCGAGCSGSPSQSCASSESTSLPTPTGLAPDGNIHDNVTNITWNAVAGANNYAIRVNDLSQPWDGSCGPGSVDDSNGNLCRNLIGNITSYPFTFVAGHSYHVWVHAINDCAPWSNPAEIYPNVYTNVVGTVFIDYNGNGSQDLPFDAGYAGTKVTLSNGQSATTVSDGTYGISNVVPGTYTESIAIPNGYTIKYPNPYPPTVYAYSPNITQNFGIQPPPPLCGNLTAQSPIYVGQTSNLNINCTSGGGTGTPTYTWYPIALDPTSPSSPALIGNVVNPDRTDNANIYSAPGPGSTFQPFIVDATVTACNPGTTTSTPSTCTSKIVPITVNPLFAVSGFVYTDANKNHIIDTATENYYPTGVINPTALSVNVCQGANCKSYSVGADGHFNTTSPDYFFPSGSTNITLTGTLPAGYDPSGVSTYNETLGSGTCTVPTICSQASCSVGSVCCACTNGNIINLPFGINDSHVWKQSTGGDIYEAGGITYSDIPSNAPVACGGPHMSISQDPPIQMPGLILTGNGLAGFGAGDASLNNWIIGQGDSYPNTITLPGTTSYSTVKTSVNNLPVRALPCASGDYTSGCVLDNNLPSGVYSVNGDLTLTGTANTYTFPTGGIFTFLIGGNLTIKTAIHVPVGSTQDGSGSFVLFTTSGDINVDPSIGTATKTDTTPNIEGYYSTDQNFIVQGTNNCPTKDLKLNVAGAIITNATNASPSRGSFQLLRDMCENDDCPTFSVQARPDLVLNAPSYIQATTRIWQELAP